MQVFQQQPSFSAISVKEAQKMEGKTVKIVSIGPSFFDQQYVYIEDFIIPNKKYLHIDKTDSRLNCFHKPPGYEQKSIYLLRLFHPSRKSEIQKEVEKTIVEWKKMFGKDLYFKN